MADEIIYFLFSAQWIEAVPYFKWLSLSIWAQMIFGTTGSVFQSAGDTRRLFITGFLTTCLTVVAISLGVMSGDLLYVARNVMIAYNAQFLLVMYILIHKSLGQKYRKFLYIFLPEIVMAICLSGIGCEVVPWLTKQTLWLAVIGKIVTFSALFLCLAKILKQLSFIEIWKK